MLAADYETFHFLKLSSLPAAYDLVRNTGCAKRPCMILRGEFPWVAKRHRRESCAAGDTPGIYMLLVDLYFYL
jgi:hypothetical protein